ncbi:MAG: IS3 family transposase [Chloroflexi bacterium]|nr:IS3 family transposase [Chloroflexota bacterium]
MAKKKSNADSTVRRIRRQTRKQYSAEDKIRIVIDGLRGELSVAELCRREGISQSLYYKWSKEFLEAGKQRLAGNTKRQAASDEVSEMRNELDQLKLLVAELSLKNRVLKKSFTGLGGGDVERLIRYSPEEKQEIIHLVEHSDLSVRKTLEELNVPRSTFYEWYQRYQEDGIDGLTHKNSSQKQFWNRIPNPVRKQIVKMALRQPEESPRQITYRFIEKKGYFVSDSSVYRILKSYDLIQDPAFEVITAKDRFENPTKRVNEMWQTDFTQFKIIDWGWYYLSTVLDDHSRYILAWKLSPTENARDAEDTLKIALKKAEIETVKVYHRPRLLSDNGPAYHSVDLATFLKTWRIKHIHGAPYHPMTQGKIERWHRSMKNVIKLQNYYSPQDLEKAITAWVDYYNNERYHESLKNVTPADVYFGRQKEIIERRNLLKEQTLASRRELYVQQAAV